MDKNTVTGYQAVSFRNPVFTPEQEADLAEHIVVMSQLFQGLSPRKCRQLAYQFAQRNGLKMHESWAKNKVASEDWFTGFKERNNLAVRKPEATSIARASAFNRPNVEKFYDNLADVMDRYGFEPNDIYNLDETGVHTVQNPRSVVAARGQKQVGSITSAERGELVTVVYTICANGSALPPMFLFPKVKYRNHFIRGAPVGSVGDATKTGWMNEKTSVMYLKHVIKTTRCTTEKPILLIMDNHESQCRFR